MKICILTGSPRANGNTAELLKPFVSTLIDQGSQISLIDLPKKSISNCTGCYSCQSTKDSYGCILKDDIGAIMEEVLASDLLVLATPIYSWYCTAPMKAFLDRHFGLNKYYGKGEKVSLWKDKKIALITTHGYDMDYGTGLFEAGIKRLCEHSHLQYIGMYSVRDEKGLKSFQTEAAMDGATAFALNILKG